jgi:hypothetical protein
MTIQEAMEKAKAISVTGDVYIVESMGDTGKGVKYHNYTVIIDGVNASSLPSWEDCFAYHANRDPAAALERVESLRRELAQAEAVVNKLAEKMPPGVEDGRD